MTEINVSITVRCVGFPDAKIKIPFKQPKPGSLTCDAITLPAPVASTINAGSAWVTLIIGNTTPAVVIAATVAEPNAIRSTAATVQHINNGDSEVPVINCEIY